MNIRSRFRLFFRVVPVVVFLVLTKALVHELGFEFLSLNGLIPSLVAGAIFIIGFLLSHVLSDYKESERLPGEMRVALEGIHDDISAFAEEVPEAGIENVRDILLRIVSSLEKGLGAESAHADLQAAIEQVDALSPVFGHLERMGLSQRYMVRLRNEQDILRRSLYRISYVQKMQFVPSVHVLVQTLVVAS